MLARRTVGNNELFSCNPLALMLGADVRCLHGEPLSGNRNCIWTEAPVELLSIAD